jgi:hypothetical protein
VLAQYNQQRFQAFLRGMALTGPYFHEPPSCSASRCARARPPGACRVEASPRRDGVNGGRDASDERRQRAFGARPRCFLRPRRRFLP